MNNKINNITNEFNEPRRASQPLKLYANAVNEVN